MLQMGNDICSAGAGGPSAAAQQRLSSLKNASAAQSAGSTTAMGSGPMLQRSLRHTEADNQGSLLDDKCILPSRNLRRGATMRRLGSNNAFDTAASAVSSAGGEDSDADEVEVHLDSGQKRRFVWTSAMHSRFEVAVKQLGVAHAKPQAIRQLMNCDGEEDAPTRQNIKSHLQKYRLFVQKQAEKSRRSEQRAETPSQPTVRKQTSQRKPHLPSREECLEHHRIVVHQQLELATKLQDTLLEQHRGQLDLASKLTRHSHAVLNAKQITRLAQHVMLQQQLLQHLYAMLHVHTEDYIQEADFSVRRELAKSEHPCALPPHQQLKGVKQQPSALPPFTQGELQLPAVQGDAHAQGHALDTSLLQSLLGEAGLHGAVAGAPSWAAADAFSAQVEETPMQQDILD